jgi:hypothetical protein
MLDGGLIIVGAKSLSIFWALLKKVPKITMKKKRPGSPLFLFLCHL